MLHESYMRSMQPRFSESEDKDLPDIKIPFLSDHASTPGESETQIQKRQSSNAKRGSQRLKSLDVFRGLTIVGMILVDNQGNGDYLYPPVAETDWNGLSSADFVFPFFLFIAGISMAFSMKRVKATDTTVWLKLIKRTLILFYLGLFLNLMAKNFEKDTFTTVRFPGVLQRISICSFVVSSFVILFPIWAQRVCIAGCIFTYMMIMYLVDVPGCGRGNFDKDCNAAGYLDNKIFGKNMIHPTDPEGLISSLNALCSIYCGLEFARFLASDKKNTPSFIVTRWIVISIVLVVASTLLSIAIPFNKKLYSLSFLLVTSGVGGMFLAGCYLVVDIAEWKDRPFFQKIINPFMWLGMNSIAIFVLMVALEIVLMDNIHVHRHGDRTSLWLWIYWEVFASWMPKDLASFAVSLCHLGLWIGVAYGMFKKKIFVKI